jgi:hypothetical protein
MFLSTAMLLLLLLLLLLLIRRCLHQPTAYLAVVHIRTMAC